MAKKKTASVAGALTGKTIAFVGKFGPRDTNRTTFSQLAESAGATIVDAGTTVPECLVVGDGRGGKPPADVAKIQKKHPAVDILDRAAFLQQVLPSPESLLVEMRKGRHGDRDRYKYWENLQWLCREAKAQIDLNKFDLRKFDLSGAHLEGVALNGSDLRGAKTHYTHFGDLEAVNFNECDGQHVYLRNLENCGFRGTDLSKAWLFKGYGSSDKVVGCDFTDAKMSGALAERGTFTDCKFTGADLSDAELEESIFQKTDFNKADLSRLHAAKTKFTDCKFAKANLNRADLREASLVRADLRGANLREAVLNNADLTGADVTGADFQNAVLSGATLKGVDFSKAKNFTPPVVRQAGPKLLELAQAFAGSKNFEISAEVDLGKDEFAKLQLANRWGLSVRSIYRREKNEVRDQIAATTIEDGMLALVDRWPNATLRLDTIKAKGCRTLRGQKLQDLAIAAWAEAFGIDATSADALKQQKQDQIAAIEKLREVMLQELRGGKAGVEKWNARSDREREQIGPLHNLDLSGAKLNGVKVEKKDLTGSSFEKASLKDGSLWSSTLTAVNFSHANLAGTRFNFAHCETAIFDGATLVKCVMSIAYFDGASFRNANLTDAVLDYAKLHGADFSGANLTGANFEHAEYDSETKFPAGFHPDPSMTFTQAPQPIAPVGPPPQAGTLDFDSFLQLLNNKVELARIQKAGSMLKAERFQLFADVKDDSLVGIVKSQTDRELVYSCRLASDGKFGCCTQNLRPCGGLRGALCKHLLVLIVGLAKAGELDSATVDHWIDLSRSQKPAIDEESMSATFLRYKGAEAGEVDWRPTETIPEDFYAM